MNDYMQQRINLVKANAATAREIATYLPGFVPVAKWVDTEDFVGNDKTCDITNGRTTLYIRRDRERYGVSARPGDLRNRLEFQRYHRAYFSGTTQREQDQLTLSIFCSAKKSAEQVAKDIARRLLDSAEKAYGLAKARVDADDAGTASVAQLVERFKSNLPAGIRVSDDSRNEDTATYLWKGSVKIGDIWHDVEISPNNRSCISCVRISESTLPAIIRLLVADAEG